MRECPTWGVGKGRGEVKKAKKRYNKKKGWEPK
jgi:hypothetical protein